MTNRHFAYVAVATLFFITAWMARYTVSSSSKAEGPAIAYVLDRWTNTIMACQGTACYRLEKQVE